MVAAIVPIDLFLGYGKTGTSNECKQLRVTHNMLVHKKLVNITIEQKLILIIKIDIFFSSNNCSTIFASET